MKTQTFSTDSASDASTVGTHSTSSGQSSGGGTSTYRVVVLGGGAGGLAVLRALREGGDTEKVALIEPSTVHYDQPAWMQVGTEGMEKERTRSSEDAHVPPEVTWIQDRADAIDPDARIVTLERGERVGYDYLVVALGTEVLWDRIRDLKKNLGRKGICSVYGYESAEQAWEQIQSFEGGHALFTAPSTPHKSGSAPLRLLFRAEELWRETGVRDRTELYFATAASADSMGPEYDDLLERGDREDDIHIFPGYDLIDVRPDRREAVFNVSKGASQSQDVLRYDLLHVVPPMRPPAILERSELAHLNGPMRGYLEVNSETLRHPRFDTVFGIGDAIGVEGVKTGERARAQAEKVARTLHDLLAHEL